MQLKSIKLNGFKSFVDPTTIMINKPMNAIVGPNGCGKSNVVDAIRWVVGEISAKQLRGQSMTDVIFNGTTSRQPVGKASVELAFENTQGRISGEYGKFNEIAVRREVTRDGQSNYYINGASCRRKDIIDLFLGTGLGPRSYSVIEQGMISQLVEAKPEDFRAHLEEVAGISKYKERRRETENRIRRTQENLDRLTDIRDELEKQLRHLKRQANAAERYKVLKEEERLLSAQIKALQWQKYAEQMQQHELRIQEQHTKQEETVSSLRHVETEIEKGRLAQSSFIESQNAVQKRFYGIGAEVARIEQRISHHKEQEQRWQNELTETQQLLDDLSSGSVEQQQQLEEITQELESLQPQSSSLTSVAAQAQEALVQAESAMQAWQQQWESVQAQHARVSQQRSVAQTKITHLQQQLAQATQRQDRLQEQQPQEKVATLQGEINPLMTQVSQANESLQTLESQLQTLKSQIQAQREANQQRNRAWKESQQALQKVEARIATLEAMQKALLEQDDEGLQAWMDQHALRDKPRVSRKMTVQSGWELAVETVMAGQVEAICVDDMDAYLDEVSTLESGRVVMLSTNTATSDQALTASSLLHKVESDLPLQSWLAHVYAADDLTQAKQMRSQLKPHESIITKEGIWLGTNWVRVNKFSDQEDSILLREKELQQCQQQLVEWQQVVEQKAEELQQGEDSLQLLESQRDDEHQRYQQQSAQLTELKSELSSKQSQLQAAEQRLSQIQRELQDLVQQQQKAQAQYDELEKQADELGAQQQQLQAQREQLQSERSQVQASLQSARTHAQQEQQRLDEVEIRVAANQSQLNILQQTLSREERQVAQLTERRAHLQHQLQQADGPVQQLQSQLQEHLDHRLKVEEELHQVENQLNETNTNLDNFEKARQAKQEVLSQLQQRMQQLQVDKQAIAVRQTTIVEQLQEADLNLQDIMNEMPEQADINEWQQRVDLASSRISRLGPINLAAIDECKQVSERKEYLDKQQEDLLEALTVLQNAIQKIDRETRTKFRETYEIVNTKFQELFPKIFGGGRAYLELTEDNWLTTGIIVRAQPPGKKNSTIHMLSGGEKAMTAIALVFSMFHLNPAPFCILDEVDAPLDDANVGRFCALVRQMSENTQFIVISHNKVTIESVDNLMGVTMQEPGVSRIVSVDIEAAVEMAEA